jgi:hypothetical protein
LLVAPPLPRAQQSGADARPFKPEQLEQLVAPIALYPDALVAQIFMAATYPFEVVQAARFAKANPSLKDAALNEELKKQNWDDSVKALVSFPQVLTMMDSQLEWTQKLGDAVLAQQKETLDAVQRLRAKARETGKLASNEHQKVLVEQAEPPQQQTIIKIEPANPDIVYVPTYDPAVVYGGWPYPAYPPYYYYPPYYPVGSAALWFGAGMIVGGAIWGNINWGGGNMGIHVEHHNNFNRNVNRGDRVNPLSGDRGSGAGGDRASWRHNPEHRKGAAYRDAATRQQFGRGGGDSARAASRESFRGRAEQGRQDLSRGGAGQGAARSRDSGLGSASGGQRAGDFGRGGGAAARGDGALGSGSAGPRGGAGGGRAFEGVGQGQSQRSYSQRGQSSRGGSFSGSGSVSRGGGGFSGGGRGGGGGRGRR